MNNEELPLEEEQDNKEQPVQDIGSVLKNVSEDDLNKADTFEDFLAQQQITEPQEPVTTEEPQSESQSNSKEEPTEDTEVLQEWTDEEFRKLITSPFKANHKEVQVDNPNDAIKLMQLGMNYHKKMGEIAPHRKILKSLEQNGLLDTDKLNFAIDLMKGDKSAIAKFIKDKQIDTYELPDIEENPYQAKDYMPTDSRIVFDEKIQELQQSEAGQAVYNYIRGLNQDDFYEVYSNPAIIDNLLRHSESGLMNDTAAVLEKEYALGRVPTNLSPLQAYDYLSQQLENQSPSKYSTSAKAPKVIGTNKVQTQQPKANVNKAPSAASIPNNGTQNRQTTYSGVDLLLNASDEDLNKYDNWEQFLQANNLNL